MASPASGELQAKQPPPAAGSVDSLPTTPGSSVVTQPPSVAALPECESVDKEQGAAVECPLCLHALAQPVVAHCCGKSYCEHCAKRATAAAGRGCPNCRADPWTYTANLALREVMDKSWARCQGCGAEMRLENFATHCEASCTGTTVQCFHRLERGCTWVGKRGDYEAHLQQGCKCTDAYLEREFERILNRGEDPAQREAGVAYLRRVIKDTKKPAIGSRSVFRSIHPMALCHVVRDLGVYLRREEADELATLCTEHWRYRGTEGPVQNEDDPVLPVTEEGISLPDRDAESDFVEDFPRPTFQYDEDMLKKEEALEHILSKTVSTPELSCKSACSKCFSCGAPSEAFASRVSEHLMLQSEWCLCGMGTFLRRIEELLDPCGSYGLESKVNYKRPPSSRRSSSSSSTGIGSTSSKTSSSSSSTSACSLSSTAKIAAHLQLVRNKLRVPLEALPTIPATDLLMRLALHGIRESRLEYFQSWELRHVWAIRTTMGVFLPSLVGIERLEKDIYLQALRPFVCKKTDGRTGRLLCPMRKPDCEKYPFCELEASVMRYEGETKKKYDVADALVKKLKTELGWSTQTNAHEDRSEDHNIRELLRLSDLASGMIHQPGAEYRAVEVLSTFLKSTTQDQLRIALATYGWGCSSVLRAGGLRVTHEIGILLQNVVREYTRDRAMRRTLLGSWKGEESVLVATTSNSVPRVLPRFVRKIILEDQPSGRQEVIHSHLCVSDRPADGIALTVLPKPNRAGRSLATVRRTLSKPALACRAKDPCNRQLYLEGLGGLGVLARHGNSCEACEDILPAAEKSFLRPRSKSLDDDKSPIWFQYTTLGDWKLRVKKSVGKVNKFFDSCLTMQGLCFEYGFGIATEGSEVELYLVPPLSPFLHPRGIPASLPLCEDSIIHYRFYKHPLGKFRPANTKLDQLAMSHYYASELLTGECQLQVQHQESTAHRDDPSCAVLFVVLVGATSSKVRLDTSSPRVYVGRPRFEDYFSSGDPTTKPDESSESNDPKRRRIDTISGGGGRSSSSSAA
ncbi:unnamed protein product [Amoebophrya sp. A120]|nr:unnamed protein product [Amoebophrya sp. A120]|eukprot:GSA120T00015973001.1